MLIRERVARFANRVIVSRFGLWLPEWDLVLPRRENVLAILEGPRGRILFASRNIVTDDGDLHYAQRGAAETPTNAFGTFEQATAADAGHPSKTSNRSNFTTVAGSQKATDTGYPKTNDTDADNTGAGTDVVTWLVSYTKADFSANNITHGINTNATPGASEPILTGYAYAASFNKTSDDTLKVFVNHTMNGV